jgi:pyruvate,orthophosphate dikinase
MGRPAVCGIGEVTVLEGGRAARIGGNDLPEGTRLAVDGDRGLVALSAPPFADAEEDPYVTKLTEWKATV